MKLKVRSESLRRKSSVLNEESMRKNKDSDSSSFHFQEKLRNKTNFLSLFTNNIIKMEIS